MLLSTGPGSSLSASSPKLLAELPDVLRFTRGVFWWLMGVHFLRRCWFLAGARTLQTSTILRVHHLTYMVRHLMYMVRHHRVHQAGAHLQSTQAVERGDLLHIISTLISQILVPEPAKQDIQRKICLGEKHKLWGEQLPIVSTRNYALTLLGFDRIHGEQVPEKHENHAKVLSLPAAPCQHQTAFVMVQVARQPSRACSVALPKRSAG
jgi:hypothetical protein